MISRYSAIDMFGVPIDRPEELDVTGGALIKLMKAYNIESQDIPTDPTDITPYYWERPAFRYFLTLASPEGQAVVDMLPVDEDSENYLLNGANQLSATRVNIRHIEIPNDQNALAIFGPGPRFPGQICVHELIVCAEI